MSNRAFDNLVKAQNLQNAKEHLAEWEKSRQRTDLTAEDIEFLDRAITTAKALVEQRRAELRDLRF